MEERRGEAHTGMITGPPIRQVANAFKVTAPWRSNLSDNRHHV